MRILYRAVFMFALFIFLLLLATAASATPPLPYPGSKMYMAAYLVFPAGRGPDAQGKFEIEVYCKSYSVQNRVSIDIAYSKEISLKGAEVTDAQQTQLFKGRMEQVEAKTWRLSGVISENAIYEGEEMPASIALYIDYPCPPEPEQEMSIFGTSINNEVSGHKKMTKNKKQEQTDKLCHIVKALPVWLEK